MAPNLLLDMPTQGAQQEGEIDLHPHGIFADTNPS